MEYNLYSYITNKLNKLNIKKNNIKMIIQQGGANNIYTEEINKINDTINKLKELLNSTNLSEYEPLLNNLISINNEINSLNIHDNTNQTLNIITNQLYPNIETTINNFITYKKKDNSTFVHKNINQIISNKKEIDEKIKLLTHISTVEHENYIHIFNEISIIKKHIKDQISMIIEQNEIMKRYNIKIVK